MKIYKNVFIILVILAIVTILSRLIKTTIEYFEIIDDIDFYIITMRPEDRLKNIEDQKAKLKSRNYSLDNIHLLDAVVGKDLDIAPLISSGKVNLTEFGKDDDKEKEKQLNKREVACYLSHEKAIATIAKQNKPGYSVIFEDDFTITDDFLDTLDSSLIKLKNIDFDILFLGISMGNPGEKLIDNIYNIQPSWGAYGYLVNNNSANKILNELTYINNIIDIQMTQKGVDKKLIVYRLDPLIVHYVGLESSIR